MMTETLRAASPGPPLIRRRASDFQSFDVRLGPKKDFRRGGSYPPPEVRHG
jgi:hypothetical protein